MIRSHFWKVVLPLFLFINFSQLSARQGIFSYIYELFAQSKTYSRYQLYKILSDENMCDNSEIIAHIKEQDDFYLDIIEQSISKREQSGPKSTVSAQIKKCAWAGIELSAAALCSYYAQYLPKEWQDASIPMMIAAGVLGIDGFHKLYKGITYKSRMKKKLERDKLVRREIRQMTNLI